MQTRAGPSEEARLCRQGSILIPFVPQDVQGSVFSTGFVGGAAQRSLSKRSSTHQYLNAMCALNHSISAVPCINCAPPLCQLFSNIAFLRRTSHKECLLAEHSPLKSTAPSAQLDKNLVQLHLPAVRRAKNP